MLNPIDLTAKDPALYVNRFRSYFNNLPPINPRQQTTKPSVQKDITSWTHVFLRKDTVRAPSLHLIPVLIVCLHAQTNLSPWMRRVKKRLYQSIGWNRPLQILPRKSLIFPPHIIFTSQRRLLTQQYTHLLYLHMSPLHVVVGQFIGPRSYAKQYIHGTFNKFPDLFCTGI